MKILNALERISGGYNEPVVRDGLSILLRLLSPITPHICHALWLELKFGNDIMKADWPDHKPEALEQDEIEYVVQVNGKTRGNARVPKAADQKTAEALAAEAVKKYIDGKPIRKTIIVPGRLINLVV